VEYFFLFISLQKKDVFETVKNRRTIRKYLPKDINPSLLNDLLETSFRASTMGGMQLYSVIVTRDAEMKEKLSPAHFNQPMVKNAPVVLTFCADFRRFSKWCEQRKAVPGYDNLMSFMNASMDTLLVAQTFCTLAEAVAQKPGGTAFNPLFLYGASGVGKTHLANAIGTKIKEIYPEKRVLYVSAHLFQVQYTDSVRNNTTNDFINFYQTIDVLIIDDIQEFAGVTKTQNNFFHIFNHLHQNGKQLILTSDRAPVLLQGIEERLLTRFKWGMVAELEKPTVELRKNILRNKIHRDGLQFPPEVIDYIAENVNESVRDLEGIVIAIMARSTIFNKEIDLDLAQHIVHGVVHNETKAVTIDDILKVVCKHFDLEPSAIHTKSRKREVVQARQIAMYLAKNHTDFSTSKIGKFIGNKDHATVLHACKTVKGQLEVDKSFSAEVQEIESLLKKRN
jgi:chromosomal replication initiator protein